MSRQTLLRTPRGLEFPLVPTPYCKFCTNPIAEKWAKISGRCWSCSERLKALAAETDRGMASWESPAPRAAPPRPYAFQRAAAVGLYIRDAPNKGEFGALVSGFKYRGERPTDLAEAMDLVLQRRFSEISFDIIVPIPPEPDNERNAPLVLARALASRRDCRVINALSLAPDYKSDKGASREAKFNATRGKFGCGSSPDLAGRKVLLVDDVMTTAGHAHWAAEALLGAGVASVNVLVLARTIDLESLRVIGYAGRA